MLVVVLVVGLLVVLLQRSLPFQRVVHQTLPFQLQMLQVVGLLVLLWQLQLGQARSRLFRGPWLLRL